MFYKIEAKIMKKLLKSKVARIEANFLKQIEKE
jgi:hypothetical protein